MLYEKTKTTCRQKVKKIEKCPEYVPDKKA